MIDERRDQRIDSTIRPESSLDLRQRLLSHLPFADGVRQIKQQLRLGQPEHLLDVFDVRCFSPTLSSRSSSESESRIDPAPALATSSSASSSALIFSFLQMSFRCPAISRVGIFRKSYRWQRDRIVGNTFLRLGRRKDEFHMARRLLQRLEQRVERRLSEHVHFVDDVNLKPAGGGRY